MQLHQSSSPSDRDFVICGLPDGRMIRILRREYRMAVVALSELLGSPVYSSTGSRCGRVREVGIVPQEDPTRLASMVVKTRDGNRLVSASSFVAADAHGLHTSLPPAKWPAANGMEGMLLLERDLLDQQIIDVHGRKVVRVNDADITLEPDHGHLTFKLTGVDVG